MPHAFDYMCVYVLRHIRSRRPYVREPNIIYSLFLYSIGVIHEYIIWSVYRERETSTLDTSIEALAFKNALERLLDMLYSYKKGSVYKICCFYAKIWTVDSQNSEASAEERKKPLMWETHCQYEYINSTTTVQQELVFYSLRCYVEKERRTIEWRNYAIRTENKRNYDLRFEYSDNTLIYLNE